VVSEAIARQCGPSTVSRQQLYRALKALAEAKNQKVLILPLEASSVIGAIAGVGEIAREAFGTGGNSASAPGQAKPQAGQRPRSGSVPTV
jgi:hypothetical protein